MKNQSIHAMLLALVGGYMLFIAWHLVENVQSGSRDMPLWAAIAAIAVFALAGVGVLVYAFLIWRKAEQEKKNGEEGKNSLSRKEENGENRETLK